MHPLRNDTCPYREYRETVARFLKRAGVADLDLEDAVQDTFVVVHRRRDEFEGRSTLSTWILGIAAFVARTYRRRSRRRTVREVELADDNGELCHASSSLDPYAMAVCRQELTRVASLISELPHRWQALVFRACVRGDGPATAAASMAMSPRAAERALAKARARLRQAQCRR